MSRIWLYPDLREARVKRLKLVHKPTTRRLLLTVIFKSSETFGLELDSALETFSLRQSRTCYDAHRGRRQNLAAALSDLRRGKNTRHLWIRMWGISHSTFVG